MVRDYIITAYEKWDARLFKKWFGKGTPESNADVKFRFKRAMDMMFSSSRFWKVLCCKSNRAFVCRNCSRNTIAYVLGKSWHNRPHVQMKSTSMRMCPYAFDRSRFSTVELGFTVLHELMHMSSGVGDQGYSKKECFHLAKRDPQRARLNAAAYCYFAMESAMPKAKYEKASGGMSIMNENCRDRFSNCFDLAR